MLEKIMNQENGPLAEEMSLHNILPAAVREITKNTSYETPASARNWPVRIKIDNEEKNISLILTWSTSSCSTKYGSIL
ncbi:hypothetical protein DsansV1_C25g0186991 [Dioscorea sansibarensis]